MKTNELIKWLADNGPFDDDSKIYFHTIDNDDFYYAIGNCEKNVENLTYKKIDIVLEAM